MTDHPSSKQKARRRPNTAKVRRGLSWVTMTAQADLDVCEPGDLTAKDRSDIEAAFAWLRQQVNR